MSCPAAGMEMCKSTAMISRMPDTTNSDVPVTNEPTAKRMINS